LPKVISRHQNKKPGPATSPANEPQQAIERY